MVCSGLIFYSIVLVGFFFGERRAVFEWGLSRGGIVFRLPIVIDVYRVVFSLVVSLISSIVMLFRTRYMIEEENLSRFVWLVGLFVVFMNCLIFVPRFIGVILGWDGLGLISFILVIYYQRDKALGAGLVTGIINRVGDSVLLIGVGLLGIVGY